MDMEGGGGCVGGLCLCQPPVWSDFFVLDSVCTTPCGCTFWLPALSDASPVWPQLGGGAVWFGGNGAVFSSAQLFVIRRRRQSGQWAVLWWLSGWGGQTFGNAGSPLPPGRLALLSCAVLAIPGALSVEGNTGLEEGFHCAICSLTVATCAGGAVGATAIVKGREGRGE